MSQVRSLFRPPFHYKLSILNEKIKDSEEFMPTTPLSTPLGEDGSVGKFLEKTDHLRVIHTTRKGEPSLLFNYRRKIPLDLIKYFPHGSRSIERSLKARTEAAAKAPYAEFHATVEALFRALRSELHTDDEKCALVKRMLYPERVVIDKPVKFSELAEKFIQKFFIDLHLDPKTIQAQESAVALFIEIVGDKYLKEITRKNDIEKKFLPTMKMLPANFTKLKKYKAGKERMKISQILALPEADRPPMDPESANTKIGFIDRMFAYAVEDRDIEYNPVAGLRVPVIKDINNRPDKKRSKYNHDELQQIFDSLTWDFLRPSRLFVPLIHLFQICRTTEAAQIYLKDIFLYDGIWVIDHNTLGQIRDVTIAGKTERRVDKSLKNFNSYRVTPIHPFLWEHLGLRRYWEANRDACHSEDEFKSRLLFPELPTHRDGYGNDVSDWFSSDINAKICGVNSGRSLYSMRHYGIDFFKQRLLPGMDRVYELEILNEFIGHKSRKIKEEDLVLELYGKRFTPQIMFDLIRHFRVDLDFTNIRRQICGEHTYPTFPLVTEVKNNRGLKLLEHFGDLFDREQAVAAIVKPLAREGRRVLPEGFTLPSPDTEQQPAQKPKCRTFCLATKYCPTPDMERYRLEFDIDGNWQVTETPKDILKNPLQLRKQLHVMGVATPLD
jgi:integrase